MIGQVDDICFFTGNNWKPYIFDFFTENVSLPSFWCQFKNGLIYEKYDTPWESQ
jgi:hypothetical protein